MSRSPSFRNMLRAIGIARFCEDNKISTREGLERTAALEARASARRTSRREFLADTGKLAVLGAVGSIVSPLGPSLAAPTTSKRIAIVGAGLAGLACADKFKSKGVLADLYDANARVGGRCWSLGGDFFPGQVVERGGEFIGSDHSTMLGYVNRFRLSVSNSRPEFSFEASR